MLEDWDETMHMLQGQASQQISGGKPAWFGYIVQYNIEDNTVLVANPVAGDPVVPDDSLDPGSQVATPLIVGPMPLCTQYAGRSDGFNPINQNVQNYGWQLTPVGGGSLNNALVGQSVLVANVRNETGYGACAFMLYNTTAKPPGGNIPVLNVPIKMGEWLFVAPSGMTYYIDQLGNISIFTMRVPNPTPHEPPLGGNLLIGVGGGISAATTDGMTPPPAPAVGDIDLLAAQKINATASNRITLTSTNEDILFSANMGQIVGTARDLVEFESQDEINLIAQGDAFVQGVQSANLLSEIQTNVAGAAVLIQTATTLEAPGTDIEIISARDVALTAQRDVNSLAVRNTTIAAGETLHEQGNVVTRTSLTTIEDNAGTSVLVTAAQNIVETAGALYTVLATNITEIATNASNYVAGTSMFLGVQHPNPGTPGSQSINITNNPNNTVLGTKVIQIDGRSDISGHDPPFVHAGQVNILSDFEINIQSHNSDEDQTNGIITAACDTVFQLTVDNGLGNQSKWTADSTDPASVLQSTTATEKAQLALQPAGNTLLQQQNTVFSSSAGLQLSTDNLEAQAELASSIGDNSAAIFVTNAPRVETLVSNGANSSTITQDPGTVTINADANNGQNLPSIILNTLGSMLLEAGELNSISFVCNGGSFSNPGSIKAFSGYTAGTEQPLVVLNFILEFYNPHTHMDAQGGFTGPPIVQAPQGPVTNTTVFEAA